MANSERHSITYSSFIWLLTICLLLTACQTSSPFGPSDQEIAWQAMAQTYNSLAEYVLKEKGCTAEELIYVTPINVPELEAVFPNTQFFRGGGRRKCIPQEGLEHGGAPHSLVAVRRGQAYPLHNVALWSDEAANDHFQAFNRLLKDSGITVTPENEAMIAKAAVAMMLFYEYDRFFDARTFAVPDQTKPADYQLGESRKIDEYPYCLESGGFDTAWVAGHFTVAIPVWTSQEGRVSWWRIAFSQGQLSLVQWRELGLYVNKAKFEIWVEEELVEIDKCDRFFEKGGEKMIHSADYK